MHELYFVAEHTTIVLQTMMMMTMGMMMGRMQMVMMMLTAVGVCAISWTWKACRGLRLRLSYIISIIS